MPRGAGMAGAFRTVRFLLFLARAGAFFVEAFLAPVAGAFLAFFVVFFAAGAFFVAFLVVTAEPVFLA